MRRLMREMSCDDAQAAWYGSQSGERGRFTQQEKSSMPGEFSAGHPIAEVFSASAGNDRGFKADDDY
jgi:hypothetical protein